ncbi:MAG: hypothetical protein AMXMBFR53_44070 [Gemmatimonadota bacterium]
MSPLPPRPSASQGTDARDAVADVLRDQAERAHKREEASRPPRDRTPLLWGVAVVLAGAAGWLWLAPPAFILPPPLPAPPPELVEAEVRMTLYQAVLRLEAFRDSAGAYPERLEQAFEGLEDLEGLVYLRVAPGQIRLEASRGAARAAYRTGDSLAALAGEAVRVMQRVRP